MENITLESRPIRPEDYAIIREDLYIIDSIDGDKIIIIWDDEYVTLVPDQVGDYFFDDIKVSFTSGLTGNYLADIEILALLPNKSLQNACSSNMYINILCKKDKLWSRKLELEYKKDILDYVRDNYKKKYFFINSGDNGTDLNKLRKEGTFDSDGFSIAWKFPETIDSNNAAENGYIDLMTWFAEKYNILPDKYGIIYAVRNDHIQVLNWLNNRELLEKELSTVMNNASVSVLNWLESKELLTDDFDFGMLLKNFDISSLNWLDSRGLLTKKLDSLNGKIIMYIPTPLHIIEWLRRKNIRYIHEHIFRDFE